MSINYDVETASDLGPMGLALKQMRKFESSGGGMAKGNVVYIPLGMAEQAEALMAHTAPEDQFSVAMELVAAWRERNIESGAYDYVVSEAI